MIGAMNNVTILAGAGIAGLAVVGATVAVCLGHIDSSTYSSIVGGALVGGIGVGAHAAGVKQGQP